MKRELWFCVIGTALAIAAPQAAAGECSAAVEPGAARLDNGDVYTNFRVLPNACPGGCSGYVSYRVHYKNRNGNAHFYSGSSQWRSRKGEDLSIAGKGFEGHCSRNTLGPCRLMNIEVLDTSCYDR